MSKRISSPSRVIPGPVVITWLAIPSEFKGLPFNRSFFASPLTTLSEPFFFFFPPPAAPFICIVETNAVFFHRARLNKCRCIKEMDAKSYRHNSRTRGTQGHKTTPGLSNLRPLSMLIRPPNRRRNIDAAGQNHLYLLELKVAKCHIYKEKWGNYFTIPDFFFFKLQCQWMSYRRGGNVPHLPLDLDHL